MATKRLKNLLATGDKFVVTAEFVPLPGHNLANFEKFLTGYAEKKDQIPDSMALAGVTIPQSPGGVASMSPVDIYAILDKKNLWGDLDVIPHVTTKDNNLDAIETYLVGMRKMHLESVLALTGDKPAQTKGVFEVDSVGLVDFIQEMNNQAFSKAKPGGFDKVHQFFIAAAVSQFKYTEASQMQQYYKMAKKVRSGAQCLMSQVGWDWRKSEELVKYMKEESLDIPLLGNVYFLTTMTPAPRLMHDGKLPGCVVTKELFDKLRSETPQQHLERAAQQVAMYRDLGVAGVDLGGIFDFDMLLEILQKAEQIGADWRQHRDNLAFGVKNGWYLYQDNGTRRPLSRPAQKLSKRNFNLFHHMMFEPGKGVRAPMKKLFSLSKGMRQGAGGMERIFHAFFEKPMKSILFHCEECGDCFLYENFSICSMGRCEKGLDNAPCGDAEPDGTCGNNPDIRCVGELIYESAASEGPQGLTKLATRINPNRNPLLAGTSSILNNFFDRDHCRKVNLIQIGDCLHALIPKVSAALEELLAPGGRAFEQPSGALAFISSLINSQAKHNADYIAINIDKFAESDAASALELIRHLIRLVKKQGRSVPICVDTAHLELARAALQQWYQGAPSDIAPPLLKAFSADIVDEIPALRKDYAFKVMHRLPADTSAQNTCQYADKTFDTMLGCNFCPDDIFFEIHVTPLMNDVVEQAQQASRTCESFFAVRKIMQDRKMKGVHTALGVADSARKVPGRSVGICRAYIASAQKYGLDTVMADTTRDFGIVPAAPDLVALVDAFARQDGSESARQKAQQMIDDFCKANQKAKKK